MSIKKGQSLMEYAILISVIISAVLIMQIYIKRTYQGRLKQEADEVGQQYSPGHTTSLTEAQTASNSTTCTGGNCWGRDIPYGVTVTMSNTQNTMTKREGVDSFARDE